MAPRQNEPINVRGITSIGIVSPKPKQTTPMLPNRNVIITPFFL